MVVLGLYAVLALGVSFLCSIGEAVLLSLTPSFIASLEQKGMRSGELLRKLKQDVDRPLAAILTLNTIAHTVGAGGVGAQAAVVFGSAYVGVATGILTLLILIFTEIIPKTLGAIYWRTLAPVVGRGVWVLIWLLYPLVALSERLTKLLWRGRTSRFFRREEFTALAVLGAQEGIVAQPEAEMLDKVFGFADRRVLEVMMPRPAIVWLESGARLSDFLSTFAQSSHSHFPVYKDSIDNVIGVLFIKDVLKAQAEKSIGDEDPIRSLVRPAYFVPETKRIGALFSDMQSRGDQIAIVIDEFGGTAGLVTMDQLVTEIVGRVGEELERKEEEFKTIDEKTIEVDGGLHIDDANEELGLGLPNGQYETVAGFILSLLGHIPTEGEQIIHDNLRLVVAEMEGVKIEKVLISRL
jgi:putative hemolysin